MNGISPDKVQNGNFAHPRKLAINVRLLAICGSACKASYSRRLLSAAVIAARAEVTKLDKDRKSNATFGSVFDSGGLSQSPISHQEILGAAINQQYRPTGTACSLKSDCNQAEEQPFRHPISVSLAARNIPLCHFRPPAGCAAQPTANLKISTRSSEWPVWSKAQVE